MRPNAVYFIFVHTHFDILSRKTASWKKNIWLARRETRTDLFEFAAPEKVDDLGLEGGVEEDIEDRVDQAVEQAEVETWW